MPLLDSIQILIRQGGDERFNTILKNILSRLKGGASLSSCLKTYPGIFSNLYVSLVEVGELTGRLADMLGRISAYLEKIADLKRKLLQAMTYPALVILVAIFSLSFVLYYVIPTFSTMFRDFGSELPWLTLVVLQLSHLLRDYTAFILMGILLILFTMYRMKDRPGFQRLSSKIVLNLPVLGELIRKNYITQFCRTLGTLLGSGVSLLRALDVVLVSVNNYHICQDIQKMKFFVTKGEKLTHSLGQSNVFPLMVIQMISVGEETAELPFMLQKIADHYDKEVDNAIETLSSVIEPLVIILLGVIIGTILISIYLPLFNLTNIMPG
jgi:type IV pilus assembly protein PilC